MSSLNSAVNKLTEHLDDTKDKREELYKWFHQHPELSMALKDCFCDDAFAEFPMGMGSEDFAIIPEAFDVPYCYWGWSGFEEGIDGPANHTSTFAPALQPSLDRGTAAIIATVGSWLIKD